MSFAVVIPLYNHEAFIDETIRSVLAQSRPVDRIIVVDDGSTDRSADIVRGFSDERILLIAQENAGAHAALNRGIREAAGFSCLGILNSDDIYHPDRVEKCVKFLEEHPDCDLVCTGLRMIDESSRDLKDTDPKSRRLNRVWSSRPDDLLEWLGIANFAKTTSNFAGRSSYFQAHLFRPYRYVHDFFFLIICALEEKLGVLPEPLLGYRTHGSNTIKSSPPENVIRETVAMNLDVLREIGPELARSELTRRNYVHYLRALSQNHSDFRAELFMCVLAGLAAKTDQAGLCAGIKAMSADRFPELRDTSSRVLGETLARSHYIRLQQALLKSRWYALGRILGLTRNVIVEDHKDAQATFSLLKKRVTNSRWLSFGRRFGLFRSGIDE